MSIYKNPRVIILDEQSNYEITFNFVNRDSLTIQFYSEESLSDVKSKLYSGGLFTGYTITFGDNKKSIAIKLDNLDFATINILEQES